jgi:hypothetical protein
MLRAVAADRDNIEDTWEQWNADLEKMIPKLEERGIQFVRVPLDVEEIERFWQKENIPNDGAARSKLALRKSEFRR